MHKTTYKQILLSICIVLSSFASAQDIKVSFPLYANKEYSFALNKGINRDIVQQGTLSASGSATLTVPAKDKDYAGMGSLIIDGSSVFNFIVNHENFEVEQGLDLKYAFKDSRENEYLYSIIQDKAVPQPDSTLYASHFVEFLRYMQRLNKVGQGMSDLREKVDVKLYALNQLDMEQLYTSSVWYNVVDGLMRLDPGQKAFGENMVKILKRIKSLEVFEHLTENLITITDQYGWDDAFNIIIPYVEESGRIKVPQGNIYVAFALAKIRPGTIAPPIHGLKKAISDSGAKKTLLVFYQPDCENCHIEMQELIKSYPELEKQGVRVVSISSDEDKESFEKDKKLYPWPDADKLCDLQGFAGENFKNYAIMGTPTFYLIDGKGIVIKRYALLSDIDFGS